MPLEISFSHSGSDSGEEEPAPSLSQEEQKELERQRQYYSKYLGILGDSLALSRHYSVVIDPQADTFAFDHKHGRVIVSPKLVESLDLTPPERKFGFLHELGHLIQLLQDPDSYLESFGIPSEVPPEKAKEHEEAYCQAYKDFFNSFLDIHANRLIYSLIPVYQRGGAEEMVPHDLYAHKLFREDLTLLPLSHQFLYACLRMIMAPDVRTKVSPRVEQELNAPLSFFGTQYEDVLEFVRHQIANHTLKTRDIVFRLRNFLLPIFQGLLEEDIAAGRIIEIQEGIGTGEFDDSLPEGAVRDIAEGIKRENRDASEKYDDYLKGEMEKKLRKAGLSEHEIERILEIQKISAEIISKLERLWENFIQRFSQIARDKQGGFKTGASVSPEHLASQIPVLLTQPDQARIFYRYLPTVEREEIKPKKITLVLILDLSGSMDSNKRKAVQEVAYSLAKSLINFSRTGIMSAKNEGQEFPVDIYYRLIGFGSSTIELLPETPEEARERKKQDQPNKDLDVELAQAIMRVGINLGGTNDSIPLSQAQQMITPETEERLQTGEEVMVVIEITDGETATANASRKIVGDLNSITGVYARAIQIEGAIYSETPPQKIKLPDGREIEMPPEVLPPTGTFEEVWGEYGRKLKDLDSLPETVLAILYDALRERLS